MHKFFHDQRKILRLSFNSLLFYFSNAGHSNYSSSSLTFYFFCIWNVTNNYVFRLLTLLLHCLIHPHCYCFVESKEGTVRWTTPDPFLCMGFESHGMFHKSYPSVTAAKIHVNRHSPACKEAALGFRELRVETTRLMRRIRRQMFGTSRRVSPGYSHCLLLNKKKE